MNNIQKMENKAYKAYVKELKYRYKEDSHHYKWALTGEGRKFTIRSIRASCRCRVDIIKDKPCMYVALKTFRDYSFNMIGGR